MDDPRCLHGAARGRQISSDSGGGAFGSDFETGRDLVGNPQTARDRICVAFIEDHRLVREGITALLGRFADFEVVAADSDDYATVFAETGPDVVLLRLGLGNGNAVEIVRTLRTTSPGVRVLLMDLLPAQEDLVDFIAAGVSGFVIKDAGLEVVRGTIRAVAAGLKVIPDQITGPLFSEIARESVTNGGTQDQDAARLTPREREVIDLLAEGLSNKAISRRLHISIHTVKSHLRNVMEKLTLHSRLQVAKYVHEQTAGARLPAPDRRRNGATPLAGATRGPLMRRTASRSGTEAPGRLSRPGAGRRAFGSRGRSRRRSPPRTSGSTS